MITRFVRNNNDGPPQSDGVRDRDMQPAAPQRDLLAVVVHRCQEWEVNVSRKPTAPRWPASSAVDRRGCELRPPRLSDHRPPCNVSGSAVRDRDVNRDHPRAIDHPAIDYRERLWDRRIEIAAAPFAIFLKIKKIGSEPVCRCPAMAHRDGRRVFAM